jgi:hypothetical protein
MVAITKGRLGVSVAMALAVAGLVTASSLPASGVEPAPAEPIIGNGTLKIVLTPERTGFVELTFAGDMDGSQTVRQDIVTQEPCAKIDLQPLPGARGDLLTFTPIVNGVTTADDSVQIPSSHLGVHRGSNCGNPAGQIGPGEELRIELGPYFGAQGKVTTIDGVDYVTSMTQADLFIRKTNREDGSLQWKVGRWDTSGIVETPYSPVTVPIAPAHLVTVTPEPGFRTITLRSTASNASRGLSLVTETSFVVTNVVSETVFEVNCGQQITKRGESGDTAEKVVYLRGENGEVKDTSTDADACSEIQAEVAIVSLPEPPVGIDATDFVFWDNTTKDVDGNVQRVNALVRIEWAPRPASSAGNPTLLDYDGYGPGGFTEARWCESFSQTAPKEFSGELPDGDEGEVGLNADGTVPWCLVSQSNVLNGLEVVRVDTFYGSGDPGGNWK